MNHSPANLDPRAFRTALGSFVTGVTIVTTRDRDGVDTGLTANSFNSVSLDPPLILWSLALNATTLPAFRDAEWWAVHILAAEQESLSGQFAQKGNDRFAGVAITRGPGCIPLLEGCAARFICRTAFEYEGGDHAIFVGHVTEFDHSGGLPLVYHGGRYSRVLPGDGHAVDESLARLGRASRALAAELDALPAGSRAALHERMAGEDVACLRRLLGELNNAAGQEG